MEKNWKKIGKKNGKPQHLNQQNFGGEVSAALALNSPAHKTHDLARVSFWTCAGNVVEATLLFPANHSARITLSARVRSVCAWEKTGFCHPPRKRSTQRSTALLQRP